MSNLFSNKPILAKDYVHKPKKEQSPDEPKKKHTPPVLPNNGEEAIEQTLAHYKAIRERFKGRFVKPVLKASNGRTIQKRDIERHNAAIAKYDEFTKGIVKVFIFAAHEWNHITIRRSIPGCADDLAVLPLTDYNFLAGGLTDVVEKDSNGNSYVVQKINRKYKDDVNMICELFFTRVFRGTPSTGASKWEPRAKPKLDDIYIDLLNHVVEEQKENINKLCEFFFSREKDYVSFKADIQLSAITEELRNLLATIFD